MGKGGGYKGGGKKGGYDKGGYDKGGYGKGDDEDTSRDWQCDKCDARNFARRGECFKCKLPRPRPEWEEKDPAAERERKLKVAIAMGYDPEMAETIILDPRFSESVEQYEKMQKQQSDQQEAVNKQYQQAIEAQQQAQQAAQAQQMLAAAMQQGYTAEQAQAMVQQYLDKQKKAAADQAEAEKKAAERAESGAPPEEHEIVAAAMAQGYNQEQAQAYAQQYLQQHKALQAQQQEGGATSSQAAPQAERVAKFATVPLILGMDEGRRGEHRATLKAVVYTEGGKGGGKRSFRDVYSKGPWRDKKEAAVKDQQEMSEAFKYDGEDGLTKRVEELENKEWKQEELDTPAAGSNNQAELEEDDFDAEAEAAKEEPEPEVSFDGQELPVRVRGVIQFGGMVNSWDEAVQRGSCAPAVAQALVSMQMPSPTLIQRFSMPLIALTQVDLLAQAQTGSGKTLAFVIPIVSRLVMNPPINRPYFPGAHAQASPIAVLMSPTRELAIQTSKNVVDLLAAAGSPLKCMTLYGGEPLSVQVGPIAVQNQDIICATPGRLLDAVDHGKVSLSFAGVVVLDEADQMMDLAVGLEGTVTAITDGRDMARTDGRQTLLFSATMPDFQTKQFHSVLKGMPNRAKLRVGHYNEDEKGGSCRHITQHIIQVYDMDDRWRRLGNDLMEGWGSTRERRQGKGILFTNRIALAHPLEKALANYGISCGQLHGKQTQDVREEVVTKFRKGEYEMLIASNVASRGLDFPDIRIVVQFELPKTVEIYTHRIGRTGRNGQTGTALAYMQDPFGWVDPLAAPLAEFLRLNEQAVPAFLEPDRGGRRRSRSRSRSRSRRRR